MSSRNGGFFLARTAKLCYPTNMGFLARFLLRIALNAGAVWLTTQLLPGFQFPANIPLLFSAGVVLAVIFTIVRPILRVLSFPFLILTFGLFNIIINIVLLLIADNFISQLVITDFWSLFWASVILGVVNSF